MAALKLRQAVGTNCPNLPEDVMSVHARLMEIGKIPCYECTGELDDTIAKGILSTQRHFMRNPDGVISTNGRTERFLGVWREKPIKAGVQLPGHLNEAWLLVSPLLPEGSSCTSGYRSPEDQRRILRQFFTQQYRVPIIKKYGQIAYDSVCIDLARHEQKALGMVRGVGQQIAAPGKSRHQQGKAIDIGGPSTIDKQQVEILNLVAKAHPSLFSGIVLAERNGCVHFEIH